jgi:hypothetical protein
MSTAGNRGFRGDGVIVLALFLVSLLLYSLKWPFLSMEGATSAGAIRILDGQIPYRDFWTVYAPGSFYLHALLLNLFGMHLRVEVIAASVISALGVSSCFLLVKHWLQRNGAALACASLLLAASWSRDHHLFLGPYPTVLLLILLTLIMISRYYRDGRLLNLFAAGLLNGLAIVFKHDAAGYAGLSIAAGLMAWHASGAAGTGPRWLPLLRAWSVYAASAALVSVPVAVWFALRAGPDMLQDLIVYPLTDLRYARRETYPSLLPFGLYEPWILGTAFRIFHYLAFLLPFLLAVSAALVTGAGLIRARRWHAAFGVTFVLAWLFHYTSAHVQINTNIISMTLYAGLLGALLYDIVAKSATAQHPRLHVVVIVLLVGVWCTALVVEPAYKLAAKWREYTDVMGLPRISGMRSDPRVAAQIRFLNEYINQQMTPGEQIFLALHRHDITVISYAGLYFILGKMNPTRHDQLHPGVVDRADYQRGIIGDLERQQVDVVFMQYIFRDRGLDIRKADRQRHLPEIGATKLDDYIRSHFYRVDRLHRFEIWRRRTVPATQ